MRTLLLGALLVRALNAQIDDPAVASASASTPVDPLATADPALPTGPGDDTTSATDALTSDTSSGGFGGFDSPDSTGTESVTSTTLDALANVVGTADVILSTLSSSSPVATADVILSTLSSSSVASGPDVSLATPDRASSTASAVLFALGPSSSASDDTGVRFGLLPETSTTSLPAFASSTTSSRSVSSSASGRAGQPASALLPVGPGGKANTPGSGGAGGLAASATPSPRLNVPLQPGSVRPRPVAAVGKVKAKASPSTKSATGKFGSLSVGNPGAGGAFHGLAVGPHGGATSGSRSGTSGGAVHALAAGKSGGTVNALYADPAPYDAQDDDEDTPRRPGPSGWDGENNGIYDGEDYNPAAYYAKQKAKYIRQVVDAEDCPSWCHDEPDADSYEEHPVLKKKKKMMKMKKMKKTKAKNYNTAPVDDSDYDSEEPDDEPEYGPNDKLRRTARPQDPPSSGSLGGFSWPTKQGSYAPSDAPSDAPPDADADDDNDDDDDDDDDAAAYPVKKVKVKKVKKKSKGKGRCPDRCLGKAPGPYSAYTPTTLVTSTTSTTIYDSSVTATPTETPYIVVPPGPYPGPPAANNVGSFNNPGTGPDANTLAGICPATCDAMNPATNKCDITTTCITTGGSRYYCACPAGYRFDGPNPADFGLQFRVDGEPYVYGATGQACSTVCQDQTCSEVPVRQQCA